MTIVPNGNHQAISPGNNAPAQKNNPYKTLKLGGKSPGQRETAAISINKYGNALCHFPFTRKE